MSQRRARQRDAEGTRKPLTARQEQILLYLAEGLRNREIGERLGISEQGVKTHLSALMGKFQAPTRAALGALASVLRLTGSVAVDSATLLHVFQNAPAMVAITHGPEHVFVLANRAFERAAGGRPLVGRSFREALPELLPQGALERSEHVYRTGEGVVFTEARAAWDRTGDGTLEEGFLTFTVQPVRDARGAVSGLCFFGLDVTESARARRTAAELVEERAAILDLLPSAVVVVDTERRIVATNAAMERLVRVRPGTLLPPLAEFVALYQVRDRRSGRLLEPDEGHVSRALRGEHVPDFEIALTHPDSRERIELRGSAVTLRDAEGRIRGAIGVFTRIGEGGGQ